jgi:RND family efflux transporter MFP subunit
MSASIPVPPRHTFTRLVLPLSLVAAALAALAWTGWRSLVPVPTVDVVPVSVRAADAAGRTPAAAGAPPREGAPVQAPGWVEPAPFATMVPALVTGTVRSVDVLEGQRVEAEQPVAHLVDDEARIAAELATAMHAEAEAKAAEMKDELSRKEKLVASGAASVGEVARLRLRAQAMEAGARAAAAELDLKRLQLARTVVRAPSAGVVMARLAVPGMMVGAGDGKPVVELYDPAQLQVRADVPLADAGRIAIGDRAEIMLDVLPGRTLRGEVVRIVHQADIAKNTVQAKVRIEEPAPELKPEMLARVKVFPKVRGGTGGASADAPASSAAIWAPADAVTGAGDEASALVIDGLEDGRGRVARRAVTVAGPAIDGWVPVTSGLRAGDLLVRAPASAPAPGTRVRIHEAWREGAAAPAAAVQGGLR